ncbi:MAG: class II glutamine amidotransferase, partial [Myxococcales bacterium]|nr:class II glutamine amidotransferase [Myxococcales bacterium]
MTQLLALSFDSETSPSIRLRALEGGTRPAASVYGWGVAWYPSDGAAAMVIKDPTSLGHDALTHVLSDWERFSATVFVAHLRGAAKRRTQQDTHPFVRSYGGRDWVLTHNGDLRHGFREALPLPAEPAFEPVGSTDSEHLFCWVLERLRERRVRRLRDLDPATLLGWLRDINTLGTLNLVLSDGQDLVAYSDAFGYRPLWWVRHRPPDQLIAVRDEEVEIKVGTSADTNRTVVVFSSRPLSDAAWERVVPGSLVSARRGEVVW